MPYILLFIIVTNTTIAYAIFFKRKFEENLVLTIASYIAVLFLTGILGNLNIGFYAIIVLNILLLGYNTYAIIKKRISVKNQILTFGFILFIITYIGILWISIGRKCVEWDEFSHWSLVVKNMFSFGNFGLGEESTVLAKSYLSGTSIFQFFCTKLAGEFREDMLFIGMNIMLVSTIIPIFKNIEIKKSVFSLIGYIVLLLVPIYFYESIYSFATIYTTLLVDGTLALIFSYTIYSYFSNYKEGLSKFKIINLAACLALLTLVKDFGIIFAAGCVLIVLIDNVFISNKFSWKDIWKNIKYTVLATIPMILIKIIWVVILKANGVVARAKTYLILPTIINFFKGDLLPYQQLAVQNYLKKLIMTPLTSTGHLTFVLLIFLAIVLAYIITKKSKNREQMEIILSLCILGSIAYAILLMFVPYLSIFKEYEAVAVVCYPRYMNTYILGLIFMEIAILVNKLLESERKYEKYIIVFLGILIIFSKPNYIKTEFIEARDNIRTTVKYRNIFNKAKTLIENNVKEYEKVYLIASRLEGQEFYVIRYEISPIKTNEDAWRIGYKRYRNDDTSVNIKREEQWKEELLEEYDYVYLFQIDEKFIENYGSLFYNKENIKNNQLYKINKTENTDFILQLVAE